MQRLPALKQNRIRQEKISWEELVRMRSPVRIWIAAPRESLETMRFPGIFLFPEIAPVLAFDYLLKFCVLEATAAKAANGETQASESGGERYSIEEAENGTKYVFRN